MMVSEVWNATPDSATTGGIDGRPPVAITICSASMRVSSLITNSCGPAKRARPSKTDDIRRLDPPLTPCERGLVDPRDDPVPDSWPVDRLERRRQAELRRPADLHRHIRRVDEHLGRDTAPIEARPPEASRASMRATWPPPTSSGIDDVAGTGADDRQRELFHPPEPTGHQVQTSGPCQSNSPRH